MDRATEQHLADWLNSQFRDEDREEAERKIRAVLANDPQCLERGLSWWDVLERFPYL